MRRLLFANLVTRQPSSSTAGEAASFPALAAGQQYPIAVRWLDEVNGRLLVTEPDVAAIRASVGQVDARPPSGTWKLQIGEGASTSANTTAALDFSISASALSSAINALEDVDTAIAVDFDAGSYVFHAADGSRLTLNMRGNRLLPISFGRIRDYELDGEWYSELRLIQAPVAFTSSFDTVLPPPPSISTVRDGGTDPSGTFFWNEIQKLYIPPDFQGLYQLRRNFARTGLLSRADGPDEIQAALNKILAAENASVAVTNPAQNTAHIEFRGDLSGVDLAELEVSVFSAPPGDLTFTLDLNTAEVWAMLRDQASVSLPFELEADFYIDPADHAAGIRTVKVWSTSLTITRPVGWEGLASSATIDWLRPASPRSYIPFTIDQVLTGQQQAFSAVIGDGDETTFTIDHNLSSELCQVVVRENVSGGRLLRPDEYAVVLDSSDSLTLTFDEAPDSGALACYVVAIGPESVFQTHEHTIGQVEDLQGVLDDFGTRIALLEALLPRPGVAGTPTSPATPTEFSLPNYGEVLPDIDALGNEITIASQVVVTVQKPADPIVGTPVDDQKKAVVEREKVAERDPDALPPSVIYRATIPGIGKTASTGTPATTGANGTVIPEVPPEEADPAVWPVRTAPPKWPLLLPAVEDATVSEVETLPSLPAWPGAVWKYTGAGELLLPGGSGRKSQKVATDEYFASDGRAFWRAHRDGATNFYFAAEMERELWRVYLGDDQFPAGSELAVSGEMRTRLLGEFFDDDARALPRVDYAASYLLQCEAVPVAGGALSGAVSAPVLLGQSRLALSPSLESMRWELRISRDAAGVLASSWRAYNKAVASSASFSVPMVLRLRLTSFDVDDASANPRGQIALVAPRTKLEVKTL